jgi:hypothetical protein
MKTERRRMSVRVPWSKTTHGQVMCAVSIVLGMIGWRYGILPLYVSLSVQYLKPIWTLTQVLYLSYLVQTIYYGMVLAISWSYLKVK